MISEDGVKNAENAGDFPMAGKPKKVVKILLICHGSMCDIARKR